MVQQTCLLALGLWSSLLLLLLSLGGSSQARTATVVLMPVTGTIDLGLAPFMKRAIREAETRGATALILHLNTPGGRVDAAMQMRDTLLDASIDTVAFIDKEAYSAGALIALACKHIYMTGGAVIGAAAPVGASGQPAGEKYVSAIRKLFRATAERNGRPPEIAEAMVDKDVAVPGLVEKGKLLTLTTQEALQWQVADARVDTLEVLLSHLQVAHADVVRVELNWAESLVRVLTHPMMASLLFSVGTLALLAELLSPGFGIPGALGLTSLALFFGSHYLVGLAGWEEALLIGAGLLLLVAELLVIPGFGVAGVLGLLALGAGVFLSVLGSVPTPQALWRAGTVLLAAFGLMAVGVVAMLLLLPGLLARSPLHLRARLGQQPDESAVAAEPSPPVWLGAPGVTLTPLRPTGIGLFQGQRLEITSEGGYIPAQTPVTVIRSEENRLVVRQAAPPSA